MNLGHTVTDDRKACTKIAVARTLVFKSGPKVDNLKWEEQCTGKSWYGTKAQAERQCALDSNCGWIHDWGCDGKNWRFCGPTGQSGANLDADNVNNDKKACTFIASRPEVLVKKCHDILPDKAIHFAEFDATGSWGPYLASTPKKMTQEMCIQRCEETTDCAGWSYRDGEPNHQHHGKCFLLDSSHVAYVPKDSAHFNSGICKEYVKTCDDILEDEAIHYAEWKATKTWGPYLASTPTIMSQDMCIQRCEDNVDCAGWSYRNEDPKHEHFEKCFLLDSSHVAYQPASHDEFNSGVCKYNQRESVNVEMKVDVADSDIVEVTDPITGETTEKLSPAKETSLKASIAAELGMSQDDIIITIGQIGNPIDGKRSRRLTTGLLITITFKVPADKAVAIVETLEEPAFAEAVAKSTGVTVEFQQFKPAAGSSVCATCKYEPETDRIRVTHYINSQKSGDKGLQHKCYHTADNRCVCKCQQTEFTDEYRGGLPLNGPKNSEYGNKNTNGPKDPSKYTWTGN